MKEFNLDNIKEKTYTKIGCSNFIKEDIKRTKTKKALINTFVILLFISASIITVNAATDNALVNMVKRIIKLNDKDHEIIIYDEPSEEYYDKRTGEVSNTTPSTCIKIPKDKNDPSNYDSMCYPMGTTFEDIELYYDEQNHISKSHITGYDENGKFFEYYWDRKDDEAIEKSWVEENK